MAKFRQLHTSFWNDPLILDLTPEQKYFYIYLLTNPNVKQCGIYEISIKQIAYEIGYDSNAILALLTHFESINKIKYSKDTNEIAIINFLKYNYSNSPTVKKCIEKDFILVKNKDLISYIQSIDTVCTEYIDNNKNNKNNNNNNKNNNGNNYYNNIPFPDYYDIHYAKRIEQDINKTKEYHNHLESLGYIKKRNNYNGDTKWIKKNEFK